MSVCSWAICLCLCVHVTLNYKSSYVCFLPLASPKLHYCLYSTSLMHASNCPRSPSIIIGHHCSTFAIQGQALCLLPCLWPHPFPTNIAGLGGSLRCASNWWSGGCRFDPLWVWQHSLAKMYHEILLWSFSSFTWFKKNCCQFLEKECAQVLVSFLED